MTRRLFAPRRGQNMVEFAIVAVVLMLFTIGVVDLGRAVWLFNSVSFLAREGARYGVVPSRTSADIKAFVAGRLPMTDDGDNVFDASNVTVFRGTCGDPSDPVVVTVATQFQPLTAGLWGGLGGPLTLQASSRMYVEQC